MILKYSEGSNSPFIQIDENNKLIFSTLTEDKRKGFRWFAFNGITRQKVKYGKTGRFTMLQIMKVVCLLYYLKNFQKE